MLWFDNWFEQAKRGSLFPGFTAWLHLDFEAAWKHVTIAVSEMEVGEVNKQMGRGQLELRHGASATSVVTHICQTPLVLGSESK